MAFAAEWRFMNRASDASGKQLVLPHRPVRYRLHPAARLIDQIFPPDLEPLLAGGQQGLAPLCHGRYRAPIAAARELQIIAMQQLHN
jgi:hypothetical protein